MFLIDTRYETQPRRRFTRPDAHRYLKPVPSPALPDAVAAWARVAERAEEKRRVFERDCRRELDALRYDWLERQLPMEPSPRQGMPAIL
jgi:hypothetical protein